MRWRGWPARRSRNWCCSPTNADFGRVRIQVIDNGPGIDPANIDNIFVPFFTTKRGGSGVGLSISRQLMHANKGFISYRPGEPRGSVFTLLLPS